MVEKKYEVAFWWVNEALKHSRLNSENMNMMAVVYSKTGMYELAEQWYKFGIEQVGGSLNLLSNYRALLLAKGRTVEAQKYDQLLDEFDDNNPYTWLDLGHDAYKRNNYARSIKYFEKAIRMAPYLDKGHFELARALYASNELAAAAASMRNAIRAAFELEDRELYYAKLKALKSEFAR
jgi:Tfp pilus assembly protein PilF